MSRINPFKKPLAMIAEARSISRSFCTHPPLRADNSYQSQSPHTSILELDTKKQKALNRTIDTLTGYQNKPRIRPKEIRDQLGDLEKKERAQDLERMQIRRWKQGDVYAPHDLSPVEMSKWRTKLTPDRDVFDVLAINPIDHYMVGTLSNTCVIEEVAYAISELLDDV
ncbi:WD40 repeat-like protein [Xylographa trunciseda]|nr:WD40 repeat-like protein [Xylographa trunciseda]